MWYFRFAKTTHKGKAMLVKTILNSIEHFKSFVFDTVRFEVIKGIQALVIVIQPRANSNPKCPRCGRSGPVYDTQRTRLYEYVPLWGFPVYFKYAPRRVSCPVDGILVERVPWGEGKERMTTTYQIFLAQWAKRLSWLEVATVFRTSWDSVFRAVRSIVEYGLAHRDLSGVEAIGVDEIQVFYGHKYLTLVYQIDQHARRLLWCGSGHTVKTLLCFFRQWGVKRSAVLKYVCSDMWAPYLKVIHKKAPQALHILDRFHIMKHFGDAIDQTRRTEVRELKANGQLNVLEKNRWVLLKRPENLTEKQTVRLNDLLKVNLRSVKAYLLRQDFQQFWEYSDPPCAARFLDDWVTRTLKTNLDSMKSVAKMLRNHRALILNWFIPEKKLSSGIVEGLNLKAKLTIRKAYGFKNIDHLQLALYHTLGDLPTPILTHRFCG
jgi:transposase